jgi:hypothetical protein
MADISNFTPFSCLTTGHVDAHGRHSRLVIVKGVWHLDTNRGSDKPSILTIREEPLTQRIGDLGLEDVQVQAMHPYLEESIDWLPSDLSPPKPRFDFLVCGHAYPDSGEGKHQFAAGIVHPRHRVALVVCAPRHWKKTLLQGGGGVPGEFLGEVTRVPVHPRFSYGGESAGGEDLYNPQGMGSPASVRGASNASRNLDLVALPWIEHPEHPVVDITRTPLPASFGVWGENTAVRSCHYGTRDSVWQQQRAPLLPLDFNPLYYNQAEPRLQWSQAPQAGEAIELHHLNRDGFARIVWPAVQPQIFVDHRAGPSLACDTCLVVPDAGLYAIVWRCIVPTNGNLTLRVARA